MVVGEKADASSLPVLQLQGHQTLKTVCIYTCCITWGPLGLQDKRNETQTGLKKDCVTVNRGVNSVVLASGTTVSWGFNSIMGILPHF